MSDSAPDTEPTPQEESAAAAEQGRLRALATRFGALWASMRNWSAERPWRSAAIGASLLLMIVGTLCGWIYLSSLAIVEPNVDFGPALAAWDDRDLERATDLVRQLQSQRGFDEMLGNALFILGAIKTEEAQNQWSALRRQTDFLIASRYLEEARTYGFPPARQGEGLYLLGKSLIESRQLAKGIAALNEALQFDPPNVTSVHRLLARAHFESPDPQFQEANRQNSTVLDDATLSLDERADALLLQTQILSGQGQHDDALATLQSVSAEGDRRTWIELLHGEVLLEKAVQAAAHAEASSVPAPENLGSIIEESLSHLEAARAAARKISEVSRRAMYRIGRARQLQGDTAQALRQFAAVRRSHAATPEELAAALAEAELLQARGDDEAASAAYRRVLESVDNPDRYYNPVLPLTQLRDRMNRAVVLYVDDNQFEIALGLLEHFPPLFDRVTQAELQAHAYQQWSEQFLRELKGTRREIREQQQAGRLRLRQAGAAYERLAKLQFATRRYTDELWNSADCYFRGQSYTSATRILNEYLRHEPERRNAQVLLMLSQSHLALGSIDDSIAALEECIEFHPRDEAVYQARIDLSRSYRLLGQRERAEELLMENLTRSLLTPQSPEWRDSLFEMGSLLHDLGRYAEAVNYLERYAKRLEQSLERFDDGAQNSSALEFQAISADYLIGDCHRLAAADPLDRLNAARSQGERDKIQRAVNDELLLAEKKFNEVVVKITTRNEGYRGDPVLESMLRNGYMLLGSVLFDQGRYKEASEVYSNVSSLYQHEPFVLETYVQIAHCWRRMNQPEKAHGMIQSAQFVLNKLPPDADYLETTSFTREEWQSLINEMASW